jgi:hypothetical protein
MHLIDSWSDEPTGTVAGKHLKRDVKSYQKAVMKKLRTDFWF